MTLRPGMSGAYARSVQEFLSERSLYRGPIDSSYGGATAAGVKSFQLQHGLPPSGMVDAGTWALMFPGLPDPVSDLITRLLPDRCLALTGSFETSRYPPESFGGLGGDFDHMGISFGACQWNLGQGTLQPLLSQMFEQHEGVTRGIFHENFDTLVSLKTAALADQLSFARSIQYKGQVNEPWRGIFAALGRTPEFQDIQVKAAAGFFTRALEMCGRFGLTSERAAALMFDIAVQNGSIGALVNSAILAAFTQLLPGQDNEIAKLRIVANQVANAAAPIYRDNVRGRKLAIALGTGSVNGAYYDVEEMFAIRLAPFSVPAA